MPSPVPLHPLAGGPADLASALAALRAVPEAEREALYARDVFPFAAAAMREDVAPTVAAAELLIVPVGTQPYSPLLAILSCPCARVALLVTEAQGDGVATPGSRPTAARVIESLEAGGALPPGGVELFSIGDGTQGGAVADAVGAALFWAGDPFPVDVTLDISGGLKSTTAALGGIGAVLGCRLAYIEGRAVVGRYMADERRHALADMGALLGADHRAAAGRLLRAGAYAAAADELARAEASTLAGPAVVLLHRVARAFAGAPGAAGLAEVAAELDGAGPAWADVAALLRGGEPPAVVVAALLDRLVELGAWR